MITIVQKALNIQIIGVIIARIIVVEFKIGLICPTVVEVFVVMRLTKSILVPQFLMGIRIVKDSGGRKFASRIIIVKLDVKSLCFVNLPDRVKFSVQRSRLRIFTDFMRNAVMNTPIMKRVRIVSLGAHSIRRDIPEKQTVVAFFRDHFMGDTCLQGIESVHSDSATYTKAERFFWDYVYCIDFQKAAV